MGYVSEDGEEVLGKKNLLEVEGIVTGLFQAFSTRGPRPEFTRTCIANDIHGVGGCLPCLLTIKTGEISVSKKPWYFRDDIKLMPMFSKIIIRFAQKLESSVRETDLTLH